MAIASRLPADINKRLSSRARRFSVKRYDGCESDELSRRWALFSHQCLVLNLALTPVPSLMFCLCLHRRQSIDRFVLCEEGTL